MFCSFSDYAVLFIFFCVFLCLLALDANARQHIKTSLFSCSFLPNNDTLLEIFDSIPASRCACVWPMGPLKCGDKKKKKKQFLFLLIRLVGSSSKHGDVLIKSEQKSYIMQRVWFHQIFKESQRCWCFPPLARNYFSLHLSHALVLIQTSQRRGGYTLIGYGGCGGWE